MVFDRVNYNPIIIKRYDKTEHAKQMRRILEYRMGWMHGGRKQGWWEIN